MSVDLKNDSAGAAKLQEILEWFRSSVRTEEFDPAIKALGTYRAKLRQLRSPNQTDDELQKNYKELTDAIIDLTARINDLHIFEAFKTPLVSDSELPASLSPQDFTNKAKEFIKQDITKALEEVKRDSVRAARRASRKEKGPDDSTPTEPSSSVKLKL